MAIEMDARTLKSLKASIAKWERNAEAKTPDEYLTSVTNCPLCLLFFADRCSGCPVADVSGDTQCNSTPYDEAVAQKYKWRRGEGTASAAHAAAREEVAFLKSLLPPSTEPCGGCGETDPAKRCLGCFHDFAAPPSTDKEVAP